MLYHCWTIIHRAVRHHARPRVHRAVRHALHHKVVAAATTTVVCVAVGTPFLTAPTPPGPQAQPPPPQTAYSGPPFTAPGFTAPPFATQQNTMPTLDQLFPSLEQIFPETLPTTFPETPLTPNPVPEPSSLALFLIPLAALYLITNRRRNEELP